MSAAAAPSVAGGNTGTGPGASRAGVGDPYFPRDGNGGYDVRRYVLNLRYAPRTNRLAGVATIRSRATQRLDRFHLDLDGLTVRSVRVNGQRATWTRNAGELRIAVPGGTLGKGRAFSTVVRYDGQPRTIRDAFGLSGFFHTDDGMLIAGEPHVAATWFPANDHPIDKAAYTFRITVPRGLEAIANGVLRRRSDTADRTTWTWVANEPMASYLATANVGQFDVRSYRRDGIRFWDAIDPDLFDPVARPRTGRRFAISGQADSSYKRLSRTIAVPAGGARLSFWITRDTEPRWDFVFVEARPTGTGSWTTLPDQNGHTRRSTGFSCPSWLHLHPFLRHYQTANPDGSCSPRGTTGRWRAASGSSDGQERWVIDLNRYAGRSVDVSISYASDEFVQGRGAFVDDIVVSTGEGSTSFERDGNAMDGWAATGPPRGSPRNQNNWIAGNLAAVPPPAGRVARRSLNRQAEIIRFLSRKFGPYPFDTSGGIVDDEERLQFALENQTRPVYGQAFFGTQLDGDLVVVHELAHQWYGNSVTVKRWRHIWLNEGFATYAEWLWLDRQNIARPGQILQDIYNDIPSRDPFWRLKIGNPGPDALFDAPVYFRGAMTLQRLRVRIGGDDFFRILRRWSRLNADGHGTTAEFIRLAERVSGEQLDGLFRIWLFTPRKPSIQGMAGSTARTPFDASARVNVFARRHLTGQR